MGDDVVVDGVFKDLAWNRCERDGVVLVVF